MKLSDKIANAAGAAGRVVKAAVTGEKILAPEEEVKRRLEICRTCEHFTGTTCRLCGCLLKFKTKLETEACPIGKWGILRDMLYNVTLELDAGDVTEIVEKVKPLGYKIVSANPKPQAPVRPPQPAVKPPQPPMPGMPAGMTRIGG